MRWYTSVELIIVKLNSQWVNTNTETTSGTNHLLECNRPWPRESFHPYQDHIWQNERSILRSSQDEKKPITNRQTADHGHRIYSHYRETKEQYRDKSDNLSLIILVAFSHDGFCNNQQLVRQIKEDNWKTQTCIQNNPILLLANIKFTDQIHRRYYYVKKK